jgi:multisubunit Na+/H+ antiporter MnhF subunit
VSFQNSRPKWKLATAGAIIVAVWCVALPRLAKRPSMHDHLEFLDSKGIDASAMYYTELDAMDAILERLESR